MNANESHVQKNIPICRKTRRYARTALALFVAALMFSSSLMLCVQAAEGDLDTTFGNGGFVINNVISESSARAVAVQADGKIVISGTTTFPGDFAVARYLPNGSLDTSFGSDGLVTTDFGGPEYAGALAIQSDGMILVAGRTRDNPPGSIDDFALARYKTDGSLDTTFGSGGKVRTAFTPGNYIFACINRIALQTDDKIVACGVLISDPNAPASKFLIARYTSTGLLDTTFAGVGYVTTEFPNHQGNSPEGLAIQPDGKIVVVGTLTTSNYLGDMDIGLARYNPNGTLDTSFGFGGKVITVLAPASAGLSCNDLVLQKDGKIILAGFNFTPNEEFALFRYNPNGSLDTSFGAGHGYVFTSFGDANPKDEAAAVTLQDDGKIVAVGATGISGYFHSCVAQYNSDGWLDQSFGSGGKIVTPITTYDTAAGVTIYGNGRILTANHLVYPDHTGSALVRYLGEETPTSANLGVQMTAAPSGNTITYTITVANYGSDPSYYVTLRDNIPANTTFVSFTAPPGWVVYSKPGLGQTGTISVSKAKMVEPHPPFTFTATFTLKVRVSGAVSGTTINNRATVSSSFTDDQFTANNSAITQTPVP